MIKQLGRMIWRQSRDISVMNYPNYIVYEIFTNQGFIHISHNKTTDKVELLDGFSPSHTTFDFAKCKTNEGKEVFLPTLK